MISKLHRELSFYKCFATAIISQNTNHTTLVMGVVTIFLSKVPLLCEYQKYGDVFHSSFNVTQKEKKISYSMVILISNIG